MRDEVAQLLSLRRLPARLTAEQAAPVLGVMSHDVNLLVKAKLLKALGSPTRNSVKFFAAVDVEKLARDPEWLNRATKAIGSFWSEQNNKRGIKRSQAESVLKAA